MPKRRGEVNPRERKAALKLACAPNVLSTLEAMLDAKFSEAKANNCTLQQHVWWLSKSILILLTNTKNNTFQVPSQVPSVINGGNQNANVSNITDESVPPSTATFILKPIVKQQQRTASQTQQHRLNSAAVQKHHNNATKHATKWYAAEKEKKAQGKKGLSAEEVCKNVNETYKTNLHQKRIGNLVTKGYIGVTPPKPGAKGKIPTIAYKSICQAFNSHIKINQFIGKVEENTQKNLLHV